MTPEDYFSSVETRVSALDHMSSVDRPKPSGITAIDMYYEGIDPTAEVEYLRY